MPIDSHHDDDDRQEPRRGGKGPTDFDCPSCSAHNPLDAPLADRDEVLCNYCGGQFLVRMTDEGRMKIKEL